jgi:PQQ-dependent catabolism-associated CXXCW motif protein
MRTVLAVVGFVSVPLAASFGEVREPEGYRMEDYRAPVPPTLAGAQVIGTAEAKRLWRTGKAVFFDVMPATPKPQNLPKGTIWRDKVRTDIPGSIWLANVGYGALPPETEAYFRTALEAHGGKDATILFYCMTDCWMSWNAAKRALAWGYRNVVWYPAGADGWEKAGLPVVDNRPYAAD